MHTYPKKKLELIAEETVVPRLLEIARTHGVKGSTVLPVQSGRGHRGEMGGTALSSAMSGSMIILITDEERARKFAADVHDLLDPYRIVMMISDVEVMRKDYF